MAYRAEGAVPPAGMSVQAIAAMSKHCKSPRKPECSCQSEVPHATLIAHGFAARAADQACRDLQQPRCSSEPPRLRQGGGRRPRFGVPSTPPLSNSLAAGPAKWNSCLHGRHDCQCATDRHRHTNTQTHRHTYTYTYTYTDTDTDTDTLNTARACTTVVLCPNPAK
jgi:hypothetical protein